MYSHCEILIGWTPLWQHSVDKYHAWMENFFTMQVSDPTSTNIILPLLGVKPDLQYTFLKKKLQGSLTSAIRAKAKQRITSKK
jgi:hypothetical protein